MNLGEARSPAYLDAAETRVAVLGTSSSFTTGSPAAPSRMDMPGRPGISTLRVTYEGILDPKRWEALKDIDEGLGMARSEENDKRRVSDDKLRFFGMEFSKARPQNL